MSSLARAGADDAPVAFYDLDEDGNIRRRQGDEEIVANDVHDLACQLIEFAERDPRRAGLLTLRRRLPTLRRLSHQRDRAPRVARLPAARARETRPTRQRRHVARATSSADPGDDPPGEQWPRPDRRGDLRHISFIIAEFLRGLER